MAPRYSTYKEQRIVPGGYGCRSAHTGEAFLLPPQRSCFIPRVFTTAAAKPEENVHNFWWFHGNTNKWHVDRRSCPPGVLQRAAPQGRQGRGGHRGRGERHGRAPGAPGASGREGGRETRAVRPTLRRGVGSGASPLPTAVDVLPVPRGLGAVAGRGHPVRTGGWRGELQTEPWVPPDGDRTAPQSQQSSSSRPTTPGSLPVTRAAPRTDTSPGAGSAGARPRARTGKQTLSSPSQPAGALVVSDAAWFASRLEMAPTPDIAGPPVPELRDVPWGYRAAPWGYHTAPSPGLWPCRLLQLHAPHRTPWPPPPSGHTPGIPTEPIRSLSPSGSAASQGWSPSEQEEGTKVERS